MLAIVCSGFVHPVYKSMISRTATIEDEDKIIIDKHEDPRVEREEILDFPPNTGYTAQDKDYIITKTYLYEDQNEELQLSASIDEFQKDLEKQYQIYEEAQKEAFVQKQRFNDFVWVLQILCLFGILIYKYFNTLIENYVVLTVGRLH